MSDSSEMMNIATIASLVLVCICGICGNAIVLVVGVFKRKYRKNVTNCYILNLAVTDLLFLLISVPLTIYLAIRQIWIFGDLMCKMHLYLAHVLLQATCYTLAAMSIDRYLNVIHHAWYRRYRTPKFTLIICVLIWMVSSVFMFPYGYVIHNEDYKNINQSSIALDCNVNGDDSFFSSCLFTFGFYYVLPLSIIGLCYSRVLVYISRNNSRVLKQTSVHTRQSLQFKRRRIQRMLLGLTLAFALCWLPIHVLELLYCSQLLSHSFHYRHVHILAVVRVVAHGLSYFNSSLNPILYAILNKRYFS